MDYVFALVGPCSVAWHTGGVWVVKDEAWVADDPFVADHPEMFSPVPPRVRSIAGGEFPQVSLAAVAAASPARGKARANG